MPCYRVFKPYCNRGPDCRLGRADRVVWGADSTEARALAIVVMSDPRVWVERLAGYGSSARAIAACGDRVMVRG